LVVAEVSISTSGIELTRDVLAEEVLTSPNSIDVREAISVRETFLLSAETIKAESVGWAKRIRNTRVIS
jgi:hypothetical protein